MMKGKDNRRVEWIDGWKGFLISLVVLGHIAGGVCHYVSGYANVVMAFLYRFIYLFHMPAFFMVAGYLWRSKEGETFKMRLKRRLVRLIVPYFIWGFLSAAIFVGTRYLVGSLFKGANGYYNGQILSFPWHRPFLSILHAGDWPHGEGFRCNSVLWFLPCMFVTLVLYDLVSRLKAIGTRGCWFDLAVFGFAVVMGAIMRFYVPDYQPWGLSRAPYMMIFFAVGRILHESHRFEKFAADWRLLTAGWAMLGIVAWYYPNLSLGHVSLRWYLYATVVAIFGGLLSVGSVYLVKGRLLGLMAKLGGASMGIMLVHKFFTLPMHYVYGFMKHVALAWVILSVIAMATIVMALSFYVVRALAEKAPWLFGDKSNTKI